MSRSYKQRNACPMFKVGDIVQTKFKKSYWVGIVEHVQVKGTNSEGYYIIYSVKPKWTVDGRELTSPSFCYNEFWLYKHSGKFWEGE